jgi:hypothetical protein
MQTFWIWLIRADAGLMVRIGLATIIFVLLAAVDLRRHGHRATRWREYLFLVTAAAVAMAYGAANDPITSRISWEYFYYGKELKRTLGPMIPPDPLALAWEAAKVGMKAAWSAGLVAAAALLIANNPKPGLPQLSYRRLLRLLPGIAGCCVLGAAAFGAAGNAGWLAGFVDDFSEMIRRNEMRPFRFMAVFGIHLGGYVGGAVGTVWAVVLIRTARKRIDVVL